ncbi:MAG TPA: hypothetical protein VHM66_01455, partial [Solirubrobacterales bacterium]|nr:hypothetical protein [Solirubrobacterales bacterium]
DFADVSAVYFRPTPAAGYTVNSQDEISAIAPPGKFGVTNVSVTAIAGTSPLNPANHFRFAACLVPHVYGMQLTGARRLLRVRDCGVGRVTRHKGIGARSGRVVRQGAKPAGSSRPGPRST